MHLQVVAALVRVVCNNHDSETTKKTVSVLHNLSQHKQGLLAIFRSGGIAPLVKLLGFVPSLLSFFVLPIKDPRIAFPSLRFSSPVLLEL